MRVMRHRAPQFERASSAVVLIGEELARAVGPAPREAGDARVVTSLGGFQRACERPPAVAVLPADGALGMTADSVVRRLKSVCPEALIAVFVPRHGRASRLVASLLREGAHDLILDGVDLFWDRVLEMVAAARDNALAARIMTAVGPYVPDELRGLCAWSASGASEPLTVGMMAERARISVRTLERVVKRQMGIGPHEWISWLRLFYALETRRRGGTWDEFAAKIGMSDARGIRRLRARLPASAVGIRGALLRLVLGTSEDGLSQNVRA